MYMSNEMLLELKEAVDKGDQNAKQFWDNMVSDENKEKIKGLNNKKTDDLPVRRATPLLRNIFACTPPFMGQGMYEEMAKKINRIEIEKLNNYDNKSLKLEEEFNENKKGCILFSHQRDEGLVFWCPTLILNKTEDLPMGIAWPKNARLIDTFNF